MDKLILCLANSYKHGGRCIAGIEVQLKDGALSIVKSQYGIPTWIRPVSHSFAGEVPMRDAQGINVLSVLKIHGVLYAGNGSHSEDYYYQRLESIQSLNPSDSFLMEYTDSWHTTIFGNRGRALTPEAFENGDYSVMLIRTEGAEIYLDKRYEPKPRIKFTYYGNVYDFPITDPVSLDRLHFDESLYHSDYGVLYIVASLGVVHDGWHSKLAATIIPPATSGIRESVSIQPTRTIYANVSASQPVQTGTVIMANRVNTHSSVSSSTQKTFPELTRESDVTIPRPTIPKNNTSYNQPSRSSGSSSSGGCYVATSIYGSYDCPEVWTLRRYRDYTLSKSYAGCLFIKSYYAISPKLVKWFGDSSLFKRTFKPILDKFVCKLRKIGYQSTPYTDKCCN